MDKQTYLVFDLILTRIANQFANCIYGRKEPSSCEGISSEGVDYVNSLRRSLPTTHKNRLGRRQGGYIVRETIKSNVYRVKKSIRSVTIEFEMKSKFEGFESLNEKFKIVVVTKKEPRVTTYALISPIPPPQKDSKRISHADCFQIADAAFGATMKLQDVEPIGFKVSQVLPDSLWQSYGILPDDIVTKIADHQLNSHKSLMFAIRDLCEVNTMLTIRRGADIYHCHFDRDCIKK
ncbi:MAG: hypothetical protein KDD43_00315 [Bdellovibrionales bacterium]|nr:hypothetical protein [Bdellovibrionales bacterium]